MPRQCPEAVELSLGHHPGTAYLDRPDPPIGHKRPNPPLAEAELDSDFGQA